MAAGRHFGKRKISITQPLLQKSSPNLVCWWPWSARNVRDVILGYNKIQDGGQTPSWKTENRNNSTAIWDIVTEFGTVVGIHSPQRAVTSFFTLNKIQDGGRPPFWKKENLHNSAGIWDIFTKFGVLVAMDSPQRPVMSFLGYNKIKTKSQMTAGKFQMAVSAMVHPIHFMFGSRVNMIQTTIIKQQIFILKKLPF